MFSDLVVRCLDPSIVRENMNSTRKKYELFQKNIFLVQFIFFSCKPNLNIRLSVYPKYLMIPSTDLSKNFHSSFFSLSPLPVKFWWGLVENCKFFISKFTIFKRVFQNLKIFQKKSEIWVRKTGGVFRGQIWKNALFWKSRFFQFFFELRVPREAKFRADRFRTYEGGSTEPLKGQKRPKTAQKMTFFKIL